LSVPYLTEAGTFTKSTWDNLMTKAEQLEALALRCEQATGPDRELDLSIYLVLFPESEIARWVRGPYRRGFDGNSGYAWELHESALLYEGRNERGDCYYNGGIPLPKYTASLDAAMTLVPEAYTWGVFDDGTAWVWPDDKRDLLTGFQARAKIPAAGLTAASLRACAAVERGVC